MPSIGMRNSLRTRMRRNRSPVCNDILRACTSGQLEPDDCSLVCNDILRTYTSGQLERDDRDT